MKKHNYHLHGGGRGRVTNEMLMAQSAAGDEIAFRKLVDRNNDWLVEMITFHLNGDEARAKDIVLEFWVTAWKDLRAGKYHEDGSAEGWMKTYAFYKMRDEIRKELRHPHEQLAEEYMEEWLGREDTGILDYEKIQKLNEAEKFMTAFQKKVVNLHVLYDMTNEEISKKLHIALCKVKKAFREGMRELRKRYPEVDKTIH